MQLIDLYSSMGGFIRNLRLELIVFECPEKQQDTVKLQEIKSAPREHKRDAKVFKDSVAVVVQHLRL